MPSSVFELKAERLASRRSYRMLRHPTRCFVGTSSIARTFKLTSPHPSPLTGAVSPIEETVPPQGTSLYPTETNFGALWRRLQTFHSERSFPRSTVPIVVYNKFLVLLFTSSRPALSPFAPNKKGAQMYLVPCGIRPAAFSKSHAHVSGRLPKAPCIFLRRSGLLE